MRERLRRWLVDNIYALRTAPASPARRATALATGVFLGCSPLYGLHLVLAVLVARLFRLDIVLVFAGAQISYPFVAPLIYFAELQLGAWLRRGSFLDLSLDALRALPSSGLAELAWNALGDLVLGSLVLGVALAGLSFAGSLLLFRRSRPDERQRVIDAATRPYVEVSIATWEWARAKLRYDPVYFGLLQHSVLPDRGVLVDVGCGRGLLLVLLHETARRHAEGEWPAHWPVPPRHLALHGIELRPRIAAIAREVLGERAAIVTGDAAAAEMPTADAVVVLDVLHYLDDAGQRALLRRAVQALRPGGVLVLREADAGGGTRFRLTLLAERLMAWRRFAWRQRFCFRRSDEWAALLRAEGLVIESMPMSEGTPFANVLTIGRRSP